MKYFLDQQIRDMLTEAYAAGMAEAYTEGNTPAVQATDCMHLAKDSPACFALVEKHVNHYIEDTTPTDGDVQKLPRKPFIVLSMAEINSGNDRVKWAEGLIEQLPANHDGRNSWLINYGTRPYAIAARERWQADHGTAYGWDNKTRCLVKHVTADEVQ